MENLSIKIVDQKNTHIQKKYKKEKEIRLYMGIYHDCPNYVRVIHFLYVA